MGEVLVYLALDQADVIFGPKTGSEMLLLRKKIGFSYRGEMNFINAA